MGTPTVLQESASKLFELASQTNDLRWKRYLLEEGRRLMALGDDNSELRLQNLVTLAEKGMRDAEGRAWVRGFLDAISLGEVSK